MAAVFDAVVCGAGVSGIAAARYLVRALPPSARIAIVTKHAPCQYTSSLSTECFRDHWPTPVMRSFMGRSIELLHKQGAEHSLNIQQAGYLYVTADTDGQIALEQEAQQCHAHRQNGIRLVAAGGSQLQAMAGADVYSSGDAVRGVYPWLSPSITAAMHARNAGWTSAHTMGVAMLEEIRALHTPSGQKKVTLIRGELSSVDTGPSMDRVRSVTVKTDGQAGRQGPGGEAGSGQGLMTLHTPVYVNAGGPYISAAHEAMFGVPFTADGRFPSVPTGAQRSTHALPTFSEVHAKVIFRDTLRVIPRDAPMTIANHSITLPWAEGELEYIAESAGQAVADRLSGPLGPGAHFRPYGGPGSDAILMLWESWHHTPETQGRITEPPSDSVDHLLDHDWYPEVVVRGLSRIVPDLSAYFDPEYAEKLFERRGQGSSGGETGRKPAVDGGYYTKTQENVPLIGPAPGPAGQGGVAGAYVCGAVSGYGIMAAHAAGELLAAHVDAGTATGSAGSAAATVSSLSLAFRDYAPLMSPQRYQWPEFTAKGGWRDQLLAAGGGQL